MIRQNRFTFSARRYDEKSYEIIVNTDNEKMAKDAAYGIAQRNLPGTEEEVIVELVSIETVT